MKKMTAVLLIAVLAVSMLAMAGCSVEQKNPTNLEEYVEANEEMKAQIEETAEASDLEITIEKNTITYKFSYTETLKDNEIEEMHKALEASLAEQKATFNDLAASLEEETGLTGIQVVLVYVEGAGKELYTATYPME
ncbi:MAG: DUF4854 domain-containing protein [Eubacterium sp.]|nr:DUF4854 domain-containing protein [Eubacterium sp.]